jgi:hypothetical protein
MKALEHVTTTFFMGSWPVIAPPVVSGSHAPLGPFMENAV